jgi:hypothetical protein
LRFIHVHFLIIIACFYDIFKVTAKQAGERTRIPNKWHL